MTSATFDFVDDGTGLDLYWLAAKERQEKARQESSSPQPTAGDLQKKASQAAKPKGRHRAPKKRLFGRQ